MHLTLARYRIIVNGLEHEHVRARRRTSLVLDEVESYLHVSFRMQDPAGC